MGIIRLPSYKLYWEKELNYALVSGKMSRDRFTLIRRPRSCGSWALRSCGRCCYELLRSLELKAGPKTFFDNWFSSVDLVVHMKEIGYDCVGNNRQNRLSGCKLMEEKEMKRFYMGYVDWGVEKSTEVCLVRWFDSKAVTLVSKYGAVEPKNTCRRWDSSEKKYVEIERPTVIKEYNKYMGGVDRADMLIELYRSNLKARKWYIRIFYYVFDSTVVNAWLIYRRHC
ncbi:hypothetical protein QYM36_000180 [Artemia franciscana]|uniref:PiggyBac transposable element-derived protein domain-containing protein n=1 Tax=Artemia franciscana TaxID=6661 RepID=A0AA88LJ15_ARTSF|nr:hypothetical protein QYM36_000180 [Artemia franciscana]